MSHLDKVESTINSYENGYCENMATTSRLQLRMLYLIAQLLAKILDRIEHEPKTGHWIENKKQIHVEKIYHCSECGFAAWGECECTKYCGGCGAYMGGDNESVS